MFIIYFIIVIISVTDGVFGMPNNETKKVILTHSLKRLPSYHADDGVNWVEAKCIRCETRIKKGSDEEQQNEKSEREGKRGKE